MSVSRLAAFAAELLFAESANGMIFRPNLMPLGSLMLLASCSGSPSNSENAFSTGGGGKAQGGSESSSSAAETRTASGGSDTRSMGTSGGDKVGSVTGGFGGKTTGKVSGSGGVGTTVSGGAPIGGTIGSAGAPNGGNTVGMSGSAVGGFAGSSDAPLVRFDCPINDPAASTLCLGGAIVKPGSTVRLPIVLQLPAGCRRTTQLLLALVLDKTVFSVANSPVRERQCKDTSDCLELEGVTATSCADYTESRFSMDACYCGANLCDSEVFAYDCEHLADTATGYSWAHMAYGASSSCNKTYLYEGEVGGLLVTVVPGAPVGDYSINLTALAIGDNGTASACRAKNMATTTTLRVE